MLLCDGCLTAARCLQDDASVLATINKLRTATHERRLTTIVSASSLPIGAFTAFDDVVVMADGIVAYHGPTAQAQPFVQRFGFVCPSDMVCNPSPQF